jgi:NADP-dependent 3-hydroxy acid dehydrogenase YdfG
VIGERVCDGIPEVVVITGASAGVGRATVRKFAKHGARIGLIARGIDGLKGAQKEVEELGSKALVFPMDIGNADRVEAAAAQIEADLGEIDLDQQRDDFGLFASQGDDA